jgi:heme/copper-type cytochrome/quinol oxidase subunit 1
MQILQIVLPVFLIIFFGYLAGITFWFPKIFGFKLNERLGRYAFWLG